MARITVRVVPRAGRTAVEAGPERITVRVRAAPEKGKATAEAGRALAEALGVPSSDVRLRTGARSRTKVFEIAGLDDGEVARRLHGD